MASPAIYLLSVGPLFDDVSGYGGEYLPFNYGDSKEVLIRSPIHWLHTIKSPTFVLEGDDGNISSLNAMKQHSKNAQVHFITARGTDHFGILAPTNQLLAQKVKADNGPTPNLTVTEEEVNRLFGR